MAFNSNKFKGKKRFDNSKRSDSSSSDSRGSKPSRSFGSFKGKGSSNFGSSSKPYSNKSRESGSKSYGDQKPRYGSQDNSFNKPRRDSGSGYGARRDFDSKPRSEGSRSFDSKPSYGQRRESSSRGGFGQRRDFGSRSSYGQKRDLGSRKSRFDDSKDFGRKNSDNFRDFKKRSSGDSFDGYADRNSYLNAARLQVQEAYTGKGASLIQAVRSIDDLDYAKSLLFSRLDEWWRIHFPEFKLDNEESYCRVISETGSRQNMDYDTLEKLIGATKATQIITDAQNSYGVDFTEQEIQAVKDLSNAIISIIVSREALEKFVSIESSEKLPNLSTLLDPLVSARLLSVAGGMEKLAQMPASTIQVIGAEKALFKHLRSGTAPPKHGIIFQSSMIRSAPLEARGKISRSLAAKLAIASKADTYTGNFIADKLKADLDKRLSKILKNVPNSEFDKLSKS